MSAEKRNRAAALAEMIQRLTRQKRFFENPNEVARELMTAGQLLGGGIEHIISADAPAGATINDLCEIEERTGKNTLQSVLRPEKADALVEKALTDSIAFDAACRNSANLLIGDYPLSPKVRKFVADVLTGKVARPKRGGKYPGAHNLRDRAIVEHVERLVQQGFLETRNDESSHKDSACDIVAEALAALDLAPATYSRVKRIWLDRRGAD